MRRSGVMKRSRCSSIEELFIDLGDRRGGAPIRLHHGIEDEFALQRLAQESISSSRFAPKIRAEGLLVRVTLADLRHGLVEARARGSGCRAPRARPAPGSPARRSGRPDARPGPRCSAGPARRKRSGTARWRRAADGSGTPRARSGWRCWGVMAGGGSWRGAGSWSTGRIQLGVRVCPPASGSTSVKAVSGTSRVLRSGKWT